MTDYEVGDLVNHHLRPDFTYEFLGVGYADDRHYFRRTDDGLIVETAMPHTFEKHVPKPVEGEVWRASDSNGILRTVLCVTADYVIYSATHAGSSSEPYLHVKTLAAFMQGVRVE